MGTIVLAILVLIAGYYFLKNFEKIDRHLFDSAEGYEPFGIGVVYLSAVVGAFFGCLFIYCEMIDKSIEPVPIVAVVLTLLLMLVCYNVFQAFLYMHSSGGIFGKSLFMLVSCAFAMLVGAVGSVVVIILVIAFLVLSLLGKAAFGDSSSSGEQRSSSDSSEPEYTTSDEHGNTRTLKQDGWNRFKDDRGDYWNDNGDGTVSRED